MKPSTYLRVHLFADIMLIMGRYLDGRQNGDTLARSSAEIANQVDTLKFRLSSYGIARPTNENEESVEAKKAEANTVFRALTERHLDEKRFHFQIGLIRLGFGQSRLLSQLRIGVQEEFVKVAGTKCISFPCTDCDFKEAYQWCLAYLRNLIASLENRFDEEFVWRAVAPQLMPAAWLTDKYPEGFETIAKHFSGSDSVSGLQNEWMHFRPKVAGRLKSLRNAVPVDKMDDSEFLIKVLLPELVAVCVSQQGVLWRALVTAAMTVGNCALMEQDMKSIQEIFQKRERKLPGDMLPKQVRLSWNYAQRPSEAVCKSMTTDAWSKWLKRARKKRVDSGSKHKRARHSVSVAGHARESALVATEEDEDHAAADLEDTSAHEGAGNRCLDGRFLDH